MGALLDRGGDIASGLADRGAAIRLLARSGDRAFNASGREPDTLAAAFRGAARVRGEVPPPPPAAARPVHYLRGLIVSADG